MVRESIDFSKTKKALQQMYRVYIKSQLEKFQEVDDKKSSAELRRRLISHIENDNHPLKDMLELLGNDAIKAVYKNLKYKGERDATSIMKKRIVKYYWFPQSSPWLHLCPWFPRPPLRPQSQLHISPLSALLPYSFSRCIMTQIHFCAHTIIIHYYGIFVKSQVIDFKGFLK